MNEGSARGVDISHCDSEPIHIPGAIQPHGVLLALREPDLVVTQATVNASTLFGCDLTAIVGQPLASLLAADSLALVREAADGAYLAEVNPLSLLVGGADCDGLLHRHQGVLIFEIEPRRPETIAERTHHPLRRAVAQLQSAATLEALFEAAAKAVSALTQFERVMIYRFDEEGHGSVVAEVKPDSLEPYLGLHYPASDIPRQARELYLRNGIRIIPDARYTPAALVPSLRPDTGAPLDLSFSVLRSVSPIHLEYLANMGVRASMSVSLVVRDRLWGLISCIDHGAPRYVGYGARSDCELLARLMALLIAAFEDRDIASGRERRRPVLEALAETMRSGDDALGALLSRPEEVFALLRIDGAALVSDEVRVVGKAPAPQRIHEVSAWLDELDAPAVFMPDSLAGPAPQFAALKDQASGIVSFGLPGAPSRRFLGFRPEVLQTVDWGGDPRKPLEEDAATRLHPRRSFELWRELVRLRSEPWTPADREAAEDLRRLVVEIDLEHQVQHAQRAVRARDDLVAVVSHDLRNPLGVIQMQAAILRKLADAEAPERAPRLSASLERIQRSVDRMNALVLDLLDLAKIEAGRFALQRQAEPVHEMLDDALVILRPLADAKQIVLHYEPEPVGNVLADRERIFQVLSNLIGNAIKFTPTAGRVEVTASGGEGSVLFTVADTGPGLTPEQIAQVFNRYWQASKAGRDGTGLGLYIAKGIVEAHGGKIWAERNAERGATFRFTLPLAPA